MSYQIAQKPLLVYIVQIFIFISILFTNHAKSETIDIAILLTAADQKSVYLKHAKSFENDNPGVTIKYNFYSDADFKKNLATWMSTNTGPSLLNWQGGNRLFQFVEKNKVHNLSSVFQKYGLDTKYTDASLGAVSLEKQYYGLPISYYQWGFYYRASTFASLNIAEPKNWEEFLAACKKLKEAGITPITIGAKYKWTSAAWFDYLNLRLNGLDFHLSLLDGKVSFDDHRVRNVFSKWKELLDNEYFVDRYDGWNWSQAMPFLHHRMAGMTLIGNFFASSIPSTLEDDYRYFPFPRIDENIAQYEEAPLDIFMVPKYVRLSSNIEKLLVSFSQPEFSREINNASSMISPNIKVEASSNYFIESGQKVLKNAKGVSQFFDRDTNAEMANAATTIFTDFLSHRNINKALNELEENRQKFLL